MQKIHNFLKPFLGFILSCHIGKCGSHFRIGIYLGSAVAKRHNIGRTVSHMFLYKCSHSPPYQIEYNSGHNPHQKEVCQRRILLRYLLCKYDFSFLVIAFGFQEPVYKICIIDHTCLEEFVFFFLTFFFRCAEPDGILVYLDFFYYTFIYFCDKRTIIRLYHSSAK